MKKTICELFAGVGGFRLGFERLHSDWKTVWFSQWEPNKKIQWAHDCYVKHFGDCKDINGEYHTGEDISTVDKKNIPDHNLLVGGFPCLVGETLVMTKRGLIRMDEITVDDQVLSHDGSYQQVTKVFDQGIKDAYQVKGQGFHEIIATGNHRFYVREKKKIKEGKKFRWEYSEPKWMSVDEIKKYKRNTLYFASPINTSKIYPKWEGIKFKGREIKDVDTKNPNLWYLVGLYLGNGWFESKSTVTISANNEALLYFQQKISDAGFCGVARQSKLKCSNITIYNKDLATFLNQFGHGAENKYIPNFVFDMPKTLIQSLIQGYLDTDGHNKPNGGIAFTTISPKLAYGIPMLIEKVYKIKSAVSINYPHRIRIMANGKAMNEKPWYRIVCYGKLTQKYNITPPKRKHQAPWFIDNGYIWSPLQKVTFVGKHQVYDIEVANTHTFTANGIVTHNCQDYSVAHTLKSSKGIEGKKGVLWWQIREILIEKQPTFCLFENVDRLLKSPAKQRGRDFGIILACLKELGYNAEWRVVNAADYGAAQKRSRIFIFAFKNNTKFATDIDSDSLETVFTKSGFMAQAFPVKEIKGNPNGIYIGDDIAEVSDNFAFNFKKAGYFKGDIAYTTDIIEREEQFTSLGQVLESNVDKKYYISKEKLPKWEYLKGGKKIPRKSADGHEYIYSEGPIAYPDPHDRPGRTMLTSEGTLNRCSHAVTDPKTNKIRILTPIEAERLQGFDDNWTKETISGDMPERMRYFTMGNALVVNMVTRMGKVLDKIIDNE